MDGWMDGKRERGFSVLSGERAVVVLGNAAVVLKEENRVVLFWSIVVPASRRKKRGRGGGGGEQYKEPPTPPGLTPTRTCLSPAPSYSSARNAPPITRARAIRRHTAAWPRAS